VAIQPQAAHQATDLPEAEAHESVGALTEEVGAEGHGEGGGLPQFEVQHWPGQIVWLLILFALLYFLLSRVFLPRVGGTIRQRAETISGAVAEARRVQAEAEAQTASAQAELAAARASAQKTAADAKSRAQADAAARQAAEEAKLNQHLAQAEARIRAARDQAMGNVRGIAAETAQAITDKLTGRPATAAEVEQALSRAGAAYA
jgi:F-type H+-transporting ATPase subunit b